MPSAVVTAGTTPPPAQGGTGQAGAVTSGFAAALAQLAAQLGLPAVPEQGAGALPMQASLAPTGKLGSLTGDLGAQDGSPDRLTMELLSMLAQDPAALQRLLAQQAQVSLSGDLPSLAVAAVGAQQTEATANASGWGALAAQQLGGLVGQPTVGLMVSGKESKASDLSATAGAVAAQGSQSAQVAAFSELGETDLGASNASGQQSGAGSPTAVPAYLAAALRAARASMQANAAPGSAAPNVEASRPADGKETAGGEVLLPLGATVSTVAARGRRRRRSASQWF